MHKHTAGRKRGIRVIGVEERQQVSLFRHGRELLPNGGTWSGVPAQVKGLTAISRLPITHVENVHIADHRPTGKDRCPKEVSAGGNRTLEAAVDDQLGVGRRWERRQRSGQEGQAVFEFQTFDLLS